MRYCIVGGGILGLALARLVVREEPDADVVVLEKEHAVALHQTGRNSGVVHAGLYYEPGSLKARLCRRGMGLLQAFCAEHGIAYEECGKVVVATEERELEPLAADPRAGRGQRRPGRRAHRPRAPAGARAARGRDRRAALAAHRDRRLRRGGPGARGGGRAGRRRGPARRRGGARRRRARRAAAGRAARRHDRRGRRGRGLRRACTPTGSRARPASRPTRASSRSAASTGRCGRSAGTSSAASSTRCPTPRCRSSAST